jgi:hypothetical protein
MNEVTVIVCLEGDKPTPFEDNATGPCAECGVALQWRPNVPEPSIKLCMDCAHREMDEAEERGDEVVAAQLPEQREELDKICGPGAFDIAMKIVERMRVERKLGGK